MRISSHVFRMARVRELLSVVQRLPCPPLPSCSKETLNLFSKDFRQPIIIQCMLPPNNRCLIILVVKMVTKSLFWDLTSFQLPKTLFSLVLALTSRSTHFRHFSHHGPCLCYTTCHSLSAMMASQYRNDLIRSK
jgi:hypothetical protein